MALIACKDCGKDFSTDAKRCPHCGAKKPSNAPKLFIIFIVLLVAFSALAGRSNTQAPKTSSDGFSTCYDNREATKRSNELKHDNDFLLMKIRGNGYECNSIYYICTKSNDIKVICDADKIDGNTFYMHSNKGSMIDLKITSMKKD